MSLRCHLLTKSKFHKTNVLGVEVIFSFLTLLFFGCQQETPKSIPSTNAEVYIRYLADNKKITAEATFYTKKDSANTILNFDNVTFANHPMKGKSLNPNHTRYRIDLEKHTLAPAYEIRFWNKEQKPKSITLNLTKVDSFSFSKIIKKEKGATLKIAGNSLSKNEKISFIFTNEKNETAELKLGNISIEKPISLNKEQLSMLPVGNNEFYLIRTQIFEKKAEDFNAKGILQFFSQSIDIEVVE